MELIPIGTTRTELSYQRTFIDIPFSKSQYVINFIKYAQPRELGKLSENIIQALYKLEDSPKGGECDFMLNGLRIEVKSSRAYSHKGNRSLCHTDDLGTDKTYDCNMQQVKKHLFDQMIYMVYCVDQIVLFQIPSDEIDKGLRYSNKQHRNSSGEGQFHINKNTYHLHKKYKVETLPYDRIYDMLKESNGFI